MGILEILGALSIAAWGAKGVLGATLQREFSEAALGLNLTMGALRAARAQKEEDENHRRDVVWAATSLRGKAHEMYRARLIEYEAYQKYEGIADEAVSFAEGSRAPKGRRKPRTSAA